MTIDEILNSFGKGSYDFGAMHMSDFSSAMEHKEELHQQAKQALEAYCAERERWAANGAEIALARKVLGVSSMVHKRRGGTQAMRLKLLTDEMMKIIPDTFGIVEEAQ